MRNHKNEGEKSGKEGAPRRRLKEEEGRMGDRLDVLTFSSRSPSQLIGLVYCYLGGQWQRGEGFSVVVRCSGQVKLW